MQYDKYNASRDFGEEEMAAEKLHLSQCVNSTFEAFIRNSTSPELVNRTSFQANLTAICLKSFKFETKEQAGCLRDGLGGPKSMMCYKALAVPKFASKSSGSIRCSECCKWVPSKETLSFVAQEYIQAGSVLYFAFGSDRLALRAPLQGTSVHIRVRVYRFQWIA
jgi:hypothetical protein